MTNYLPERELNSLADLFIDAQKNGDLDRVHEIAFLLQCVKRNFDPKAYFRLVIQVIPKLKNIKKRSNFQMI